MKKWIVVCLMLCLALSLAACSRRQGDVTGSAAREESHSQAEETFPVNEEESLNITAPDTQNDTETGSETESLVVGNPSVTLEEPETGSINISEEENAMSMRVEVGDHTFTATLEDNEAVRTLKEMMAEAPIVIEMSDYSGFEKVGPLGTSLPTSNSQTTTHAGDIVLYNGNQIVIFYGSNSWSYTRLGHIDDLTGWEDALGSGDVTVTFSLN